MYKSNSLKGFSLVELILAIGIFTMAISSFAFLGLDAYKTLRTSQSRIIASEKSKEITNLIMLVKDQSWRNIVDNTNGGEKYVLNTDGFLSIENGVIEENGLTYFFTIDTAYRDLEGNLVDEGVAGAIEDVATRVINLTILFDNTIFGINEFETSIYINSWNAERLRQETVEDFEEGETIGTEIFEDDISGVRLSRVFLPDWCSPQHAHSRFDLPGQGEGTALVASPGNAYVVTGRNASGRTFLGTAITATTPPTISLEGDFDGEKGNRVYVEGDYVYVSTDSRRNAVLIIDVSSVPYQPVGVYSPDSPRPAVGLYVYGNYGFVGYGGNIDIFDLSGKTGSRAKISTISVGDNRTIVTNIIVREEYAFVTLAGYNNEFLILDISDVNNPQIAAEMSLNDQNANALFVSAEGNVAYVGTNISATSPEFFIINTQIKTSPNVIATFDTGGMDIHDLAVIQNRAILGGKGTTNYIVLKIDDLTTPLKCGELLVQGDVLALDVVEYDDKLFTYILTGDANNELQIIEGGPGGGDEFGFGHIDGGEYISAIFDLEIEDARLYAVNVYGEQPEGTSLKVRLKQGAFPDLSGSSWFGPDGTEATHFGLGENEIKLPLKQGQYFQYKIEMSTTNTIYSPILDKIEIVYD